MSVQALLAQAEKLLQKGRSQEATVKLEEILRKDPQNELAANKLASAYLDLGDPDKAVSAYCRVAKRASDLGKANKALALYRQALNVNAKDPRALTGLAEESEQLGKFSDGYSFSKEALSFFAPRKRYLEASDACARMVRCNPKDEAVKEMWLEQLRIVGSEQKLVPALVMFCGPPGIVSPEQQIGGDPKTLKPEILAKLVDLLAWFPSDPVLPYALSWAYLKLEQPVNALNYLQESIRREPDYTLAYFLFVRILIEQERLTEAQYVYSYAKELIPKDRLTEIKILNEQVLSFEKNNVWLAIGDDIGGESDISSDHFLRLIRNEEVTEEKPEESAEKPKNLRKQGDIEINVPGADFTTNTRTDFEITSMVQFDEIQLGNEEETPKEGVAKKADVASAGVAEDSQSSSPADRPPPPPAPPQASSEENKYTPPRLGQGLEFELPSADELPETMVNPDIEEDEVSKTKIYSPQDAVSATKWGKAINTQLYDTEDKEESVEATVVLSASEAALSEEELSLAAMDASRVENTRPKLDITNLNPPAVEAEPESPAEFTATSTRPKLDLFSSSANSEEEQSVQTSEVSVSQEPSDIAMGDDEATVVMPRPQLDLKSEVKVESTPEELVYDTGPEFEAEEDFDNEATVVMSIPPVPPSETIPETSGPSFEVEPTSDSIAVPEVSAGEDVLEISNENQKTLQLAEEISNESSGALVPPPLPTVIKEAKADELISESSAEEKVDQGTDLLVQTPKSPVSEKKQPELTIQFKQEAKTIIDDSVALLELADRYYLEKKYYLARKSCRKALAKGADIAVVKKKLKKIRESEFPDSLYSHISTDEIKPPSQETVHKIIESLNYDYDLQLEGDSNSNDPDLKTALERLRPNVEEILKNAEPQLRIDLGIAFLEMGLHQEAEHILQHVESSNIEIDTNAKYLIAESMIARSEYIEAANILHKLVNDDNNTNKVAAYYLLGVAYESMSQSKRSLKYFQKAAEINQSYRDLKLKLGQD